MAIENRYNAYLPSSLFNFYRMGSLIWRTCGNLKNGEWDLWLFLGPHQPRSKQHWHKGALFLPYRLREGPNCFPYGHPRHMGKYFSCDTVFCCFLKCYHLCFTLKEGCLRDASVKWSNYLWCSAKPTILTSGYWLSFLHLHLCICLLSQPYLHSHANSYLTMLIASLPPGN